jgi:hypothetical protein
MKSLLHPSFWFTIVSLLFLNVSPLFAQAATAPAKARKIPFHGTVVAMDQGAGTITLNGKSARMLHLTSSTTVIDGAGNPTTLSAASVGEQVSGSYTKDASGTLMASKLRIGAKMGSKPASTTPEPMASTPPTQTAAVSTPPAQTAASDAATASKPGPKGAKKTHFSGKVTAVDAGAGTVTIKSRTLTVNSSSVITDSTGAAASLASISAGSKVSGTCEKSADGTTMTIVTLKMGN